ncbi:MAG TPA: hypothetical protein VLK25_08555, partial [Allosphingosinicella sp.]|nr:hypothetical protein [Allosphingosinicella sp.]
MTIKVRLGPRFIDSRRDDTAGQGDERSLAALLRAGPPGPQAANPAGTNGSITTPEDVLHIFTLANFGFSDGDGHSFAAVYVTTAPTNGSLAFDGSAIEAGSLISAAAISAGRFAFEAGQNANGANFASFTFQVVDSAAQIDPSPNTLTIHVTPVNDAPIYRNFNSGSAGSLVEGQTTPLMLDAQGNGLVEDVDSSDFAGGSLRVAITLGGVPAQDVLGFRTIGGVSTSGTAAGSTVSVDGVVIGAIGVGGTGIGQDLVVEFNGAATAARVQSLVRALTYFNTAENPTGTTRIASISLNDGDGPQTSSVSLTVGVQTYNDAPILSAPTQDHFDYLPGQPIMALFQGVTMVDPDNQAHFIGGNIQINAGLFGARIELMGTRFTATETGVFTPLRDTTTGLEIGQFNRHNGGVMIANLTSAATPEVINALIRAFGFRTEGANPTLGETGASLTFFDGNLVFGGGLTSNMVTQSITVLNPGPTPIVYLNAPGRNFDSIVSHKEDGPATSIVQGGVLILDAAGGNQIDRLVLKLFNPQDTDILSWGFVPPGITVTDTIADFRRVITFTGTATVATYQDLIASLRYVTTDNNPIGNRSIEVYVESEGTPSATAYAQIYITQTDDLGIARDDHFFTGGTGPVFGNVNFDNGFGSDGDPDGVNVIAVNGAAGDVGRSMVLASGATLYVSAGGGFSFEPGSFYPNGGVESFAYTLLGGTSATATIFIAGQGSSAIFGTPDPDVLTSTGPGDILVGRAGNDTYFVNSAGDSVVERAIEGYDVVAASVSWTLTAGAYVELMTTGWIEGTAAINLAGNELDQQIWGNGAANIISGNDGDDTLFGFGGADTLVGNDGKDVFFGGAGANDSLYGGLGDDTYFADDGGDVIVELAGQGQDVAASSVDYVLGAGVSVELMTTGWIGGT